MLTCPRAGRTVRSPTKSLAPKPLQLITTSASPFNSFNEQIFFLINLTRESCSKKRCNSGRYRLTSMATDDMTKPLTGPK